MLEIYRQKLQQLVANGELGEEDAAALLRLRVMLCIPQHTVEAAHSDICGRLFGKVLCFLLPPKLIFYSYQKPMHPFIDKVIMCLHLFSCLRAILYISYDR